MVPFQAVHQAAGLFTRLAVTKVAYLEQRQRQSRHRLQQRVLQFDVPVHDALAVAVVHADDELLEEPARRCFPQAPRPLDVREQAAARRVFLAKTKQDRLSAMNDMLHGIAEQLTGRLFKSGRWHDRREVAQRACESKSAGKHSTYNPPPVLPPATRFDKLTMAIQMQ